MPIFEVAIYLLNCWFQATLLVVFQENFVWWQAGGAGEDIEAGEEFSSPATSAPSARPDFSRYLLD
ncbi:MAG: hypothetical protein RMZ43_018455 [Nostoc sp. CmiVER01]|uniref:hypothetical protein n=1 Tax=Nostoc sp. CmiVER01 TaxID=3075384 RepID=UPI002AD35256|nr:hypothetical protein [Nostoc sp. CmiVER01]MDZ8126842.1 hypothetical protein [Nostoc sp. CmiVER01]